MSRSNQTINNFLEKSYGKLLFFLVSDFLEYFNLHYTQSVFKSEAFIQDDLSNINRTEILHKLNLEESEESQPILYNLILNTQGNSKQNNSDSCQLNENEKSTVENVTPKPITEIRTTVKSAQNKTFTVLDTNFSYSSAEESIEPSIVEELDETISSGTSLLINFDKSVLPSDPSDQVLDQTKAPSLLDQTLNISVTSSSIEKNERLKPFSSLSSLQDLPPLNTNLNKNRTDTVLLPSLYSPESESRKDKKSNNLDSENSSLEELSSKGLSNST